ncbi:MAG: efflux RND transporter permease subunit [Spirochaetaceae bacterium]|nr:efflux RND transporter permease subunit [Spirochaetaceae bacterium]
MSLSKLAVSKPTTVLIIFIILAALGIYSTTELPIDLLPDMELPYIAISTSYANAGPEEVERSVTRTLESSLSSVTGLLNMQSMSSSGSSLVLLELDYGTNLDTATNEIRDKIDLVKGYLPEEAGTPLILKMDPSMMPIMQLVLTGNRTPEELRQYAEDIIQPRLEQVDGVASASISGGREKAIIIDIPRDRLEAYSLTITQIAQMIAAQNIQGSGGTIAEDDKSYSITTSGEYTSLDDIRNTVVAYKTSGGSYTAIPTVYKVLLRDIADVYEGYKDISSLAYTNGEPCVILSIQKQSGKNSVQAAEAVRKQIENIKALLPADVQLIEQMNTTDIIQISIDNIVNSVLQGAFLAIIVLLIFLRSIKSTIIIGITIPLSLVITLGLMKFSGFSLNLMTLAGLSLGVGMLVDNSIVILENIYSYRAKGAKPTVAAILGSQEMLMAITASTLTTICVFLPLIMYSNELGMIGQVFSGLTFTVVFSLLCSLIVAIILVPVLSSKYLKLENIANKEYKGFIGKIDSFFGKMFDKLDNAYAKAVRWVLHHKILTIAVILILLIISIAMISVIGFIYMPEQGSNNISISLEMPKGTTLEATDEVIRQLESLVLQDLQGVRSTTISVGGGSMMGLGGSSTNSATLDISLYPMSLRQEGWDSDETARAKIRKYFDLFPDAVFSFSSSGMSLTGSDIDVIIKSNDMEQLQTAANDIVNALKENTDDVLTEIVSNMEDGLPQVNIVIDRNKLQDLGLNIYTVSNEIKANVNGTTASRFRDGGNEIDIIVQLSEDDRSRLLDLEQIFVTNSMGQRIPLASFASYEENFAPVTIVRENQMRTIHVTAKKINWRDPTTAIQNKVERTIQEKVVLGDDVRISYGGSFESMQEGLSQFAVIIIMAIILVFAVMASQFESFLDPFIVLFTLPLSIIGIVTMYLIAGSPLNLITAVGVLILVGIVVNNGIVLVDYTNLLRKRDYSLEEACVQAAKSRLRPILMTTLTTVLGLVPMAFFPGEGSEMTQPIGQTVLGGLTFSTMMTLFLMPVLYFIFNGFRERRAAKKLAKKELKEKKKLESGI